MIEKFNWLGEKYSVPSQQEKTFDYLVRLIKQYGNYLDISEFNKRFKKFKL